LIAYIDTSALVPVLIDEQTSPLCVEIWGSAERLVSTRLVEIEAATALHGAQRSKRISQPTLLAALRLLDGFMTDLDIIEIDQDLVGRARQCAGVAPLRGYDAVHCAAGLVTATAVGAVLVSGDRQLLTTWRQLGASVVDINQAAG
jgi:predicted nucleic acid-binding protein